jgi:glycerol kinase
MVFDRDGAVVAAEYREHQQIYPAPGLVEHDPNEIWASTRSVIEGALTKAGIEPGRVSGVGITNQRETTVVWDRTTGEPISNAIVWQDTRTREICEGLAADGMEATVRRITGLPIATYFSGPKVRWILDHVEGARRAAENGALAFGTIDTWLIWQLTGGVDGGVHVTDCSNASRTMLMNLETLDWDDEMLAALDIPRQILPEIRPSIERRSYGCTRGDGPFAAELRVSAALGDQQAALFGQACYAVGDAKNTYGTGNFLLLNTGATPVRSRSGLLTTVAYSMEPGQCTYALEGSIAITGAAIQWLRDNLQIIHDAAETEAIAKSVEDSGGIYFVPAFSGLFAPHWDMYARGAVVGLTRYVTRAHLVRATLEAICYQTKEVADAMETDSGATVTALKVDGGAVKNDFLMQLQADILGAAVIRPVISETTALGAAYAAGLATGLWKNTDELAGNWRAERVFEPQTTEAERAKGLAGWKKAVERTLNWVDREEAAGA